MNRAQDLRDLKAAADFELVCAEAGVRIGYCVLREDLGVLTAGSKVAIIDFYAEGITFTPEDWQGPLPHLDDPEDIGNTTWVDQYGHQGVIMGFLPRLLDTY